MSNKFTTPTKWPTGVVTHHDAYDWLCRELAKMHVHPTISIRAHHDAYASPNTFHLTVMWVAEDSRLEDTWKRAGEAGHSVRNGRTINVGRNYPVYLPDVEVWMKEPGLFRDAIQKILHESVVHEVDEFFRYDGVLVHDPHATYNPVLP